MKSIRSLSKSICTVVVLLNLASNVSSAQDDPKTMGRCGAAQKKGDECATGICYSGKQTVYICDDKKECAKSEKKRDCKEKP